jgi:hypothetical protein
VCRKKGLQANKSRAATGPFLFFWTHDQGAFESLKHEMRDAGASVLAARDMEGSR